jgi:hypothetical protein
MDDYFMDDYFRKRMYVCSFSEINDSILMWSHYAKNHTGPCVGLAVTNSSYPYLKFESTHLKLKPDDFGTAYYACTWWNTINKCQKNLIPFWKTGNQLIDLRERVANCFAG